MKVSHTTQLPNRKLVEDLHTFSSIETNASIQGGIKVPVQLDIFVWVEVSTLHLQQVYYNISYFLLKDVKNFSPLRKGS